MRFKEDAESKEEREVKEKQADNKKDGGIGTKILVMILVLLLCIAVVVICVLLSDRENKNDEMSSSKQLDNSDSEFLTTPIPEKVTKEPEGETKESNTQAPTSKEPEISTQAPPTITPATKAPQKTKVVLASKITYDSYNNLEETSEYNYNKKGVLISEKKKIEDHHFEPGIYEYKYNKKGKVTEYIRSDLEGNYMYQVYYEYKYDANNNVILETYYAVDEEDLFDYEVEGYFEYTYDAKGNLTEEYIITNGRYLGTYTYDNTYNEDGLMISRTSYLSDDWNYMNYYAGSNYTYDAKGRLVKEEKISNGVVLLRRNITYDKSGNIIKETIYDGASNEQTTIKYEYKTIEIA